MVGIRSYGGYIPRYRLDRMKIFKSMGWFNSANYGLARGDKSVAGVDEDSVTMAVAAGIDCVSGFDRSQIDGVYLASTSLPYIERQNAGIVAGALNLKDGVRSIDFAGSLKSGTAALISALESVASKGVNNLLVCASDSRLGQIGSPQELINGDGAAAFLIGDEDVIAEYKGSFSLTYDFVDHYRGSNTKFDRQWEDRWIRDIGFDRFIPEVIDGLLTKYDLKLEDFAKVIYPCYYAAERKILDKKLGLEKEKVEDPMMGEVGEMGAAQPLAMLSKALEDAKPGDKILAVSYGNGCDALWFEVTENIKKLPARTGISGYISNKVELDRYEKYLVWRNIIHIDPGLRGEEDVWSRWSLNWRARKAILGLCGSKCLECGTPQFPPQRICANPKCGAVDKMEDYSFAEKKGKIFTYTADNLVVSYNPPQLYGVINFDGGGRFMMNMTDCDQEAVKVGKRVYFSFRVVKYDEKRDATQYFWKAVPIEEG